MGGSGGQELIRRMIGAARLRSQIYEEVEADTSATLQAMLVVVLVALATGIGNLGSGGIITLLVGIAVSLVGWGNVGVDHLPHRHKHIQDS